MTCHASHSILCNATPARVYETIRNSRAWPQLFDPCQSVAVIAEGDDFEDIRITALVNGEAMTWQSHRRFLPEVLGIETTVVEPMKLVAAMTTTWRAIAVNSQQTLLLLEHDYSLCDDIAGQVEQVTTPEEAAQFIEQAIDTNSITELGNIKDAVEQPTHADQRDHHARHSIVCSADADMVYGLIRDPKAWPQIFDACLDATCLEATDGMELVRIEAMQDGRRVGWNTERRYFDTVRRVEYRLPIPMPFLESMQGQWRVLPLGNGRCLLTVDRTWRMLSDVSGIREGIDTVAQAADFVRDFVHNNAEAEMLALRAYVEEHTDLLTTVSSRFHLPHAPDQVYAALADASAWPRMLPHCEKLDLLYDDSRHQEFVMHVRTAQGSESFRSIRQCDSNALTITYFQPEPPAMLRRHQGSWQVRGVAGGSEVIAKHTVLLDAAVCAEMYETTDRKAHKSQVRSLLEGNSRLTVDACMNWLNGSGKGQAAATAPEPSA
uniref:SRPBCC family protein n=1 Tax=Streptomyces sp. NBC_00003 TaxID=2903608 RepID=A0AAU2VC28_9ACTN